MVVTTIATAVSFVIAGTRATRVIASAATTIPAAPPRSSGAPASVAMTSPGSSEWDSDSEL